jgi:hypothetical protein
MDAEKPRYPRRVANTAQIESRATMKEAAPKAQDIAKPYQPTQADVRAFETYMAARKKAAPRLKVVPNAQGAEQVSIDHPDKVLGQLALMKGLGTTDDDFLGGLIKQLVSVGSQGAAPDEDGSNFLLSVVKGIEPRDQIETMLAAQMAAVHTASMTMARRLATVEGIEQQDCAERGVQQIDADIRCAGRGAQELPVEGRAKDDGSARPCRRGRAGNSRQRPAPLRRGWGRTKKRRNNPMLLDMRRASRCRAKSKRSGLQCRAPAACTGPLAGLPRATGTR